MLGREILRVCLQAHSAIPHDPRASLRGEAFLNRGIGDFLNDTSSSRLSPSLQGRGRVWWRQVVLVPIVFVLVTLCPAGVTAQVTNAIAASANAYVLRSASSTDQTETQTLVTKRLND